MARVNETPGARERDAPATAGGTPALPVSVSGCTRTRFPALTFASCNSNSEFRLKDSHHASQD